MVARSKWDLDWSSPVSTWGVAEWGMVAASWGMELISGSGVLLGGEIASGVITILGLSCRETRRRVYFVHMIWFHTINNVEWGMVEELDTKSVWSCCFTCIYESNMIISNDTVGITDVGFLSWVLRRHGACVSVSLCTHAFLNTLHQHTTHPTWLTLKPGFLPLFFGTLSGGSDSG